MSDCELDSILLTQKPETSLSGSLEGMKMCMSMTAGWGQVEYRMGSCTQFGNFESQVVSYMQFGQHRKNLEKPKGF